MARQLCSRNSSRTVNGLTVGPAMIQNSHQNLRTSSVCVSSVSLLSLSLPPTSLSVSLFGWWSSYWSQGQSLSWTDESDMFNVIPHVYFDLKPIWTYRKYEVPKYLYLTSVVDQLLHNSMVWVQSSDLTQWQVLPDGDAESSIKIPEMCNGWRNVSVNMIMRIEWMNFCFWAALGGYMVAKVRGRVSAIPVLGWGWDGSHNLPAGVFILIRNRDETT